MGENEPQQGHKPADKPSEDAYGRWESWSSSEVKRKAVGQIRFFSFLTELSISLQCCVVIPPDLGLSQRNILESLLIRPGGQRVYDDITQPLSLHTRPTVSLRVCIQILFGSRGGRGGGSTSSKPCLLNPTTRCNLCTLVQSLTTACPGGVGQTQHDTDLLPSNTPPF